MRNSTSSKEVKEVERNKTKIVIHSNTSIQRSCYRQSSIKEKDALVRKNLSEAASTRTNSYHKQLNQNVSQCLDILNKTVVDPSLEKELLVASKDTHIIVIDKL